MDLPGDAGEVLTLDTKGCLSGAWKRVPADLATGEVQEDIRPEPSWPDLPGVEAPRKGG